MLEKLESVMLVEKPSLVIVPGDTNSTLAGALAAAKLGIPVAHVEAGMRCGDLTMPEEMNRKVTDHISALLFCPTETATENLFSEGISRGVHLTGDVMADSFNFFFRKTEKKPGVFEMLKIERKEYYLLTVHRAGNTDHPEFLQSILEGCADADAPVLFPVHPRTAKVIEAGISVPYNVRTIRPVSYIDMLSLESCARAILTDSGGVQKEAYLHGVPCITLRETTEWPETVAAGWNLLVGANREKIRSALKEFRPSGPRDPLFGAGDAAAKITSIIESFLSDRSYER